jgi:tetratricopeptide (TPR) repeat protein
MNVHRGQIMKFPVYLVIILVLTMAPPLHADQGGSAGGGSMGQPMKRLTPEEKAVVSYNAGLKHRDKAAKYEQKAIAETNEKKFAKLKKKNTKEYNKAIDDFEKAIKYYPRFYQAHSSLGYALRKVGRYEESLAAYNESLEINSFYDQAIEYRGEAYLGLNRLDEAKEAYMDLFQNDRVLADKLIAAMIAWVAARRDDADGLDAVVIDQFAEWVDQRNTLASYIQPMGDATRDLWAESR